MKLYDAIIGTVEKHIAPIAAKVGNQPHVRAMRDGFIVAMPFIIVGSFILIFAFPPFAVRYDVYLWSSLARLCYHSL